MRRALLAWEHGNGRGHVMTLRTVAEAIGPAFAFDAALCRMDHAGLLAPLCDTVVKGASLRYDPSARKAGGRHVLTATWGEFMGDLGFRDPAFLAARIAWWQDVILARRIALVIGDYAPLALLAARSMGIPSVAVGQGYGLPPHGLRRFPAYLPWITACIHDEDAILATVNEAGWPLGVPELKAPPEVYAADLHLVRSLSLLDPYDGLRRDPRIAPMADRARQPATGEGEEVFVCFSTTEARDAGAIEAVAALGLPTRAYAPGLPAAARARLVAGGVTVEDAPVPVDLIARRSRMIVNAGQHGILCLGAYAGLPSVAIPQHLEQYYHAWRMAGHGACAIADWGARSADAVRDLIRRVYHDPACARAAAALVPVIAAETGDEPPASAIRRMIAPLLSGGPRIAVA